MNTIPTGAVKVYSCCNWAAFKLFPTPAVQTYPVTSINVEATGSTRVEDLKTFFALECEMISPGSFTFTDNSLAPMTGKLSVDATDASLVTIPTDFVGTYTF
jgi:hypothetical protein